jgi:hypothetical protein
MVPPVVVLVVNFYFITLKCGEIWLKLTDDVRVGLLNTFRERLRKYLKAKGDIIKFNKD